MAWGVLGLVALHSMVEFPLWYGPFQVATGVSIYLLWSTRQSIVKSMNERHSKKLSRHGLAIVFLLTGVVGFQTIGVLVSRIFFRKIEWMV